LLALLLALTLHVAGSPTRTATAQCQLVIVARLVEGGRQRVCLTEIDGFPAPNVTMHSRGTMSFALRNGTIRTRVRITQRFRRDGRHAAQTTRGTIVGGTGRYRHARGTVSGSGTVVDTATRLTDVHIAYRLVIRPRA
jgi:hypothetical protein